MTNKTLTFLAGALMCVAPACESGAPGDEGADGVKQDGDGGSDTDTDAGTDTDGETDSDSGDGEVATVAVSGYIGEWLEGYPPLPGVTVSIVDHDEIPAVQTGADGVFTFPDVPVGEEIIVFAQGSEDRESAASRAWMVADTDQQIWPMFLFERAGTEFIAEQAGLTYDPTRGRIVGGVWRVTDDVLVGAEVALDPEAGTLIYSGAGGLPDPDATAITENGIFVFWNVDIGEYHITASDPGGSECWAADPQGVVAAPRVRTFPDTATFSMGFTCD